MNLMTYDKIIIGAGLYGLYAALFCGKQNEKVLVLECDDSVFSRATYVNQARVHMGYHYPRSYSTAIKSAGYFERFNEDYGFCICQDFNKIYATSSSFSWTNAEQFMKFCGSSHIPCEKVDTAKYFKDDMCDGAFLTKEYTFDAMTLKEYFLRQISFLKNVEIKCGVCIKNILQEKTHFQVVLDSGETYRTDFLLNATYASSNQIINKIKPCMHNEQVVELVNSYKFFKIKYELCEIILCGVSDLLQGTGITVMDGPFFSIMPFGKTGYHSLTSVTFTPHITSFDSLPSFPCQEKSATYCNETQLGNCNMCNAKPTSAWVYMSNMARKYLKDEYKFAYVKSLFSMKPILQSSEIDDSRPTVVRVLSDFPTFVSILSGKINTVYDLDEVLKK